VGPAAAPNPAPSTRPGHDFGFTTCDIDTGLDDIVSSPAARTSSLEDNTIRQPGISSAPYDAGQPHLVLVANVRGHDTAPLKSMRCAGGLVENIRSTELT